MNKEQLERARIGNLNKLDQSYRPKINAVEVDINNSIEHELAKFICVWLIRNGVPINQLLEFPFSKLVSPTKNEPRIELKSFIKNNSRKFKHEWERPCIVTEARFDDLCYNLKLKWEKQQRRADIFVLDTGVVVEIETGKSYDKEGAITVRI